MLLVCKRVFKASQLRAPWADVPMGDTLPRRSAALSPQPSAEQPPVPATRLGCCIGLSGLLCPTLRAAPAASALTCPV